MVFATWCTNKTMQKNIQLIGLSGSLRKQSYNTMLLNSLSGLLPEHVLFEIISIADLPLYNGDLDIPDAEERPTTVTTFRAALAKADGLVIVSPEYNYSIPGGLKNAIDWASRGKDSPLLNKTIALMGVTPGMWGTVRMQMAFQQVFLALSIKTVKPEILIANAKDKFDAAGKLIDEATATLIKKQLSALTEMLLLQPINK